MSRNVYEPLPVFLALPPQEFRLGRNDETATSPPLTRGFSRAVT
jgi:hypothetical protein